MWNILHCAHFLRANMHVIVIAPAMTLAFFASPLGAQDECCNTETIDFSATESDMAMRASLVMASAMNIPPKGWIKSKSERQAISAEVCEDASAAKRAAVRANMRVSALYRVPATSGGPRELRITLIANGPPLSSWAPVHSEVLGTFPKAQSRSKVTGIRIAIHETNAGAVTPEVKAAAIALVDKAKLQSLISGPMPSLSDAEAMLAQNDADTEASVPRQERAKQNARKSGKSGGGSSTPADVGGRILRRGLGGFGF